MSDNANDVPQDVQEFASMLFNMARTGEMKLAEYVDQGVDVNLSNQDGNSLVMLAAYSGQPELVRALVERGADVNKPNGRGQTPLGGVIFKKEDEVIEILLDAGADPAAGHPSGIEAAQMFGRADLLERFTK